MPAKMRLAYDGGDGWCDGETKDSGANPDVDEPDSGFCVPHVLDAASGDDLHKKSVCVTRLTRWVHTAGIAERKPVIKRTTMTTGKVGQAPRMTHAALKPMVEDT